MIWNLQLRERKPTHQFCCGWVVHLCQKEDFMSEFRKLCENYNGKANMIESVSIFEHELTFFELQLIDALCRYGEYEYITERI